MFNVDFVSDPPADLVAAMGRVAGIRYDIVTVDIDRRADSSMDAATGFYEVVGIDADGAEHVYKPAFEVLSDLTPSLNMDGTYTTRDGRTLTAAQGDAIVEQMRQASNTYMNGPGPQARGKVYYIRYVDDAKNTTGAKQPFNLNYKRVQLRSLGEVLLAR